jgi:methylenetetrahydrofolate reductase (NADPH)
MSRLSEKLAAGEKTLTAEISPPKGAGIKKLLRHAEAIGPKVTAINITDCQRALVKMSSLAASRVLADHGYEPVFQLTCRDRNSIALQSDLMGAAALGIPNVLCLTGDPVKAGDSPRSKSVFELEAVRLLQLVASLQSGRDMEGLKMNAPTKFHVGAVVNPTLQGNANQLPRMERKIEVGAKFFQTQANYDNEDLGLFLERSRAFGAPVLAGILVLHTVEIAQFIHDNIPGIRLPDSVLERFRAADDPRAAGIDFAVETMLKIEPVCAGFHVMSVREEEIIPEVIESYYAKRNARQNAAASLPYPAGR